MHPKKFLARVKDSLPQNSLARSEKLQGLGQLISKKRSDAVNSRKDSGIEATWLDCEEGYLGIDDANRQEFAEARWAKPMSMQGPLMSNRSPIDNKRSSAYVPLTRRYVDAAGAKLAEILLPIDDKAFKLEPTPLPDMVDVTNHPLTAAPALQQAAQQPQAPGTQPAQPPAQPAQSPQDAQEDAIMQQADESARRAETRIYNWMVEGKYPGEMRKVIKDAARIGVGILKGPIATIRVRKALSKKGASEIALEIKKEIQPGYQWIDPWNFYPAEGCGEVVADGDYVMEKDSISERALRKLKDDPTYLGDQIDMVIEQGPGKIYEQARTPQQKAKKKQYEIWYYTGTLTGADLKLLCGMDDLTQGVDDDEDVNVIATMVNDTIIRAIPNPLESGDFSYHVMQWSRRIGHWAGVGVGEEVKMPQRVVNAATRAMLNNAGAASGVQIVLDQLGIIPADGSNTITPNKIWYKTADGSGPVDEMFKIFEVPSVVNEMMSIIQYGLKLAEEATGIPLVTQGQTGPTAPQTFGQAELQDNNSHTWIRSIAYAFDDQITEPVVNQSYEWLLLDPKVPDDEKGVFVVHASGSIAMVERSIQENTLGSILQGASNPGFKLDPAKAMAQFLKSKRLDPRDFQYGENEQPQASPPIEVMVEQMRGQNAIQLQSAKVQGEMQITQQGLQNDQQMMQAGGLAPHQAGALAKIREAEIKAQAMQSIQQLRSSTELQYAQTEAQIAHDNAQANLQKMYLQRDLAILQYSQQHQMKLEDVKAQLAKTAMQEQTKRQLAEAETSLAQSDQRTAPDLNG